MGTYIRRVQTMLTAEEYEELSRLAEDTGKPVSVLIREAVEEVYFQAMELERGRAALRSLISLQAPVSDWPQMEDEIIQGAIE